jgi:apolipoprotein N-acyltransferase
VPKPLQYWPYLAAPLGGALLSLCYPPFDYSGFIWAFLIPLFAALWSAPAKPKHPILRGSILGYLFGLAFFGINLSWISEVHPAAICIAFYLALYPAVFGCIASTLGRPRDEQLCPTGSTHKWPTTFAVARTTIRVSLINAAAWTGLEYLRGILFTGFGWNGLGVAFHDELLVLAQPADIIGVTGLSFMIVFVGTTFAATLRRLQLEIHNATMRPHLDFAAAVAMIIAFFFYGIAKTTQKPAEDPIVVKTLLVQANIPQEEKWDQAYIKEIYDSYEKLTVPVVASSPLDLVIWPESALPLEYYYNGNYHETYFNRLLAENDYTLIFGTNENAISEGYFNSIMTMRGNTDSRQSYRKIHLVPFGEYVPFRGKIKPLNFLEDIIGGDFDRGTSTDPLPLTKPEPFSVIPTICFEDTIGRLTRKFVRSEPQLIVNCTNDGWFGQSACSRQHMANAKFRCIELRRPMARAANTGVTCVIDETGSLDDRRQGGYEPRIIREGGAGSSSFVQGFMSTRIALDRNPPITFYAKHGDLFSILCGLGAALAVVVTSGRHLLQKQRDN